MKKILSLGLIVLLAVTVRIGATMSVPDPEDQPTLITTCGQIFGPHTKLCIKCCNQVFPNDTDQDDYNQCKSGCADEADNY